MTTPYDQLEYRGGTFAQSHPQRLASVAALFGLETANSHHCRVLELGCGDGANLIPMAFYAPESRFVGIDLAQTPIDSGCARIGRLGLSNIELRQDDVALLDATLGEFDFIIAHGLYSWVPDAVRPHILRVVSELLSANGVAYVSYNALPGCRLRHLVRELLQYRFGAGARDPTRIGEIRSFLQDISRVENTSNDAFMQILKNEIGFVCDSSDHVLFHDDLAEDSNAFYLHEFVRAASEFELNYLGEANLSEMLTMAGFDEFDAALERWAASDWLAREQYQDFTKGRRFRQTLLCRRAVQLDRRIDESSLRAFELRTALSAKPMGPSSEGSSPNRPSSERSSSDRPSSVGPSLIGREPLEFVLGQRTVQIEEPLAKLALTLLEKRFPDSVSFAELHESALSSCRQAGLDYEPASSTVALSKLFWSLARAGLLEVHREPIRLQQHISASPALSPLILDSLVHSTPLVGALHATFRLDDETARAVCLYLNGQNDLHQLDALLHSSGEPAVSESSDEFTARINDLCQFLCRQGAFAPS